MNYQEKDTLCAKAICLKIIMQRLISETNVEKPWYYFAP